MKKITLINMQKDEVSYQSATLGWELTKSQSTNSVGTLDTDASVNLLVSGWVATLLIQ